MKVMEIVSAGNYLYHITTQSAWNQIKKSNELLASHGEIPKDGVQLEYENGVIKGWIKNGVYKSVRDWKAGDFLPIIQRMVHLTRTKNINPLHMNERPGQRVIITLDSQKLRAAGYIISPRLGDYGRSSEKHYKEGRKEAEEIVYRKDDAFSGIKNLSKYVVDVQRVEPNGKLASLL